MPPRTPDPPLLPELLPALTVVAGILVAHAIGAPILP